MVLLYMCSDNAIDMRVVMPQPRNPVQTTASLAQVFVSIPLKLFFSPISPASLAHPSRTSHPPPTCAEASCVAKLSDRTSTLICTSSQLPYYCQILWHTQNSPSRIFHLFATSQTLEKLSDPDGNRHDVGHDTDSCHHCPAPRSTPQTVAVLHGLWSIPDPFLSRAQNPVILRWSIFALPLGMVLMLLLSLLPPAKSLHNMTMLYHTP